VLLESLAPGALASKGAAPEALREANPALVLASITPYGQTGPYRDYAATDITLFASTGSMYREGLPDREPLRYAGHVPRMFPGTVAAGLVMSALLRRRTTGLGDWIDVSEMDCWASHPNQISRRLNHAFSGDVEEREETKGHASAAAAGFGRGTYRCLDGYVTFLPLGDRHWPRLVELVERPELADDPRFSTREARRLNRDGWEEIFEDYVGARTVAEVFARAQWCGIPSGPLNTAERLLSDMHLGERGYLQEVEHPRAGALRYPGAPAKAGDELWSLRSAAPLLGADSERVLGELGIEGVAVEASGVAVEGSRA
jgi:crotonobetainyl-CoA:carnitine CoA-transferase CaiB-like acyl-CoA transferase